MILTSPDGTIQVALTIKKLREPNPDGERLYYPVRFNQRIIILDSPFGLDFYK